MALFDQYTEPGVYTRESADAPGVILFGDLRIPIFIGEGVEEFTNKNVTLHRGSSSVADDLVVKENITDQLYNESNIYSPTRSFQLTYFPVVKGDGTGTTTSQPTDITVLANGVPAAVTSLNGVTGELMLHDIYGADTTLEVTYYFKRKDTYFANENVSSQVPTFATWTQQANLVLSLTNPGALGNNVTLALTKVTPTSDALAVSGIGTDSISIELQRTAKAIAVGLPLTFNAAGKTITRATGTWPAEGVKIGDSITLSGFGTSANNKVVTVSGVTDTTLTVAEVLTNATTEVGTVSLIAVRSLTDLKNLVLSGITTLSAGDLTVVSLTSGFENLGATAASASFSGGAGPSSNTVFKVAHTPIVDGANGGVVTSNASKVQATVNGLPAPIVAVDGPNGLVTLASSVVAGQTVLLSYYSNNYQDTYELLPSSNVTSISNVGYGPDRADFVNGVDYVLENLANGSSRIQWGASASVATGTWTAGFTPFDASVVTTTLIDEKVYMQPVQGEVNGKNAIFTLADSPVDGSGLSRTTNDPALVQIYIGANPVAALAAGAVRVIQVVGANRTVKLYNPPASGTVYASYYRSALNDHSYTLTVGTPGITGQGTYKISNELGAVIAPIVAGASAVSEAANFASTGIVWPINNALSVPDLSTTPGVSPDETITLTFQDDSLQFTVTPAVQATAKDTSGAGTNAAIQFRTTTASSAPNGVVTVVLQAGAGVADAVAITGGGTNAIVVNILKNGGTVSRTLQEIINLFATYPTSTPLGGLIICEAAPGSGLSLTANAVPTSGGPIAFTGGVTLVQTPYAIRYKVTSSRTTTNQTADGMGLTGGVHTPSYLNYSGGGTPVGADGYLDQTYIDAATGVKFTIVNPTDALSFGYTSLPSPSYHYRPGDTLTFTVNKATARYTSSVPTVSIPGLKVKVASTYGMKAADTAVITTYNKAGNEPSIGDFYYASYTVAKSESDMGLKIYTNPVDAYAQYGDPNPTNKLSLATRLFTQNGGQIFGCIQVAKEVGLETASDQAFMTAIASLATPLPGTDRKADMIQPLTTSPVVVQYLNRHLLTQSSQRNSGEATAVYGFDYYATPDTMRNSARSIKSDRMIAVGTPGAILEIDVAGKTAEFAVGGEFLAAGMVGMMINPAIDVATTLTRQNLVGFSRLIKRYDGPTMDQMASDGVTCIQENNGAFQVRHWITTDNSSPLKREPTSRLIVDYTRKIVRRNLDQFIGRKLMQSTMNSVSIVASSTLKALVEQEIIEGFKNLVIERDQADPTVLHVRFSMKPIFALLYIDVALTVSTKL
jgi:hypothetical protein